MELSPKALKYASLCVLCVQNSLLAILMRLSRVGNFPRFNPATAVFVGEAFKLATCFAVLFHVRPLHRSINCCSTIPTE
jgi:hypothetical protein